MRIRRVVAGRSIVSTKQSDRSEIASPEARNDKKDIEVLGPCPAPIEKIRNYWRWHLILKGKNAKSLRSVASKILDSVKDIKEIKTDVDVDPLNLL